LRVSSAATASVTVSALMFPDVDAEVPSSAAGGSAAAFARDQSNIARQHRRLGCRRSSRLFHEPGPLDLLTTASEADLV